MRMARGIGLAAIIMCMATWAGAAEDGWHLQLTPYMWFVNIDGTVSVGDREADFSADFSDLVDKVDLGGGLMAVGACNHWVCFVQGDYFELSQDFDQGPGGDLESDILYVDGAFGYRFGGSAGGASVDVLGGARYFRNENEVTVRGVGSADDTSDLLDGILMLRASHPLAFLSEKLRFEGTASIGAGDSDLVWELQPELTYQFNDRFAGRAGYRRIEYEFEDGAADVDVGYQGFLVGLDVKL